MSREAWKKHDRPCPPCPRCGDELYEQFWGNGGWAKADKATDELHDDRGCIRRIAEDRDAALSLLREAREQIDDAGTACSYYDGPPCGMCAGCRAAVLVVRIDALLALAAEAAKATRLGRGKGGA